MGHIVFIFILCQISRTLCESSYLTHEHENSYLEKVQHERENVKANTELEPELRRFKSKSGRISWKECKVDQGLREDCGYYGITEDGCYARECCWGETETPGVPWCYHSKVTITPVCTMHNEERIECGSYGIKKSQCMARGCCWHPTNDYNVPWCFHIKQVPLQPGECGVPAIPPNVHTSRIVGGIEAKSHSWPWQVSLWHQGYGHYCGGSFINEQWIVSAAHCAGWWDGGSGTVVAAMHSIEDDAYLPRLDVVQIVTHEDYNSQTTDNDIMLVKLSEPIEFSDEVSPVCLPEQDERFRAGLRCYTTGWGMTHEGRTDTLQQVSVPMISRDTCNQPNWYGDMISENMVCAGYEEGGRDSCQGDSGGPLTCYHDDTWKLAGIVSWGYGCAGERQPGVYSKVSNYIEWMQDTISRNT